MKCLKLLRTLDSSFKPFLYLFTHREQLYLPLTEKKSIIAILRAKSLRQTIREFYSSIKFRLDEESFKHEWTIYTR